MRAAGAVPATIAVVDGIIRIGLTDQQLLEISGVAATEGPGTSGGPVVAEGEISTGGCRPWAKANRRDLAPAIAAGGRAATTVSATLWIARRAGLEPRVMATGGLGGVHRDASASFDVFDRPRRAGPGGWCPGGLLGDEIDPRRAGDARVARDAGRPGRRLSHRRAARLPDPLGRVAPGAPRRFAGRSRPARAAPIAPWGSPAPSCWRSPCPSRRHWTPGCCKRPSPGRSRKPDGSGSPASRSPRSCWKPSAGPPMDSASAPIAPAGRQRAAGRRGRRRAGRPLRSAARRPEVRLDPEGRATTGSDRWLRATSGPSSVSAAVRADWESAGSPEAYRATPGRATPPGPEPRSCPALTGPARGS